MSNGYYWSEHVGECRICGTDNVEIKLADFPITGSEGVWYCFECNLIICDFIRALRSRCNHARLDEVKKMKLPRA
jgi:hypothetical protein